jgi:hypothetical protein
VHAEYLPDTVHGKLDHVVEECGEVLVAFGKFMRFGPLSRPPQGGDTNVESLEKELRDVIFAATRAVDGLRAQYPPLFEACYKTTIGL